MLLVSKNPPSVTLQQVKEHLVINHNLDDDLILSYIQSSIAYISRYIGLYPWGEEYQAETDELNPTDKDLFPWYILTIPKRPTEIVYKDSDLEEHKFNKLEIDELYDPGTQILRIPLSEADIKNDLGTIPVSINAKSEIPDELFPIVDTSVKLLVGDLYKYREDSSTLTVKNIPNGVQRLLDTIRTYP